MTENPESHDGAPDTGSVAARLDGLADLPVHEHAAVIEEIHQELQGRLSQEQV
ncbi:MAG TPA: hypothetical protein VK053_01010 [Jiangellaceae bacterium]|nr:hypothetical protein [Jiangellaceae bacterium]